MVVPELAQIADSPSRNHAEDAERFPKIIDGNDHMMAALAVSIDIADRGSVQDFLRKSEQKLVQQRIGITGNTILPLTQNPILEDYHH